MSETLTRKKRSQRLLPFTAGAADSALRQISNGARNKLFPQDRAVHEWYRFILSYPPQLVREYISRFGVGPRGVVLDPFCGTGTTPVEAKKLGIAISGAGQFG